MKVPTRISTFALLVGCAVAARASVFQMPTGDTSLSFVTIGDPGNRSNGTFGAVTYVYQMGEFDVTAAQYCQFLNAVAATDTYGLYNTLMASPGSAGSVGCGIVRSGTAGGYTYSVLPNSGVPGSPGY